MVRAWLGKQTHPAVCVPEMPAHLLGQASHTCPHSRAESGTPTLRQVQEWCGMSVATRKMLLWYGEMYRIGQGMSEEDKSNLSAWERDNLDGHSVGTSDWPGWKRLGQPEVETIELPLRHRKPQTPKAVIPVALRWEIWLRDDFTCRACGNRTHLRVDHIVPESKGGETTPNNLQTLCHHCNSVKGTRIGPFQRPLR